MTAGTSSTPQRHKVACRYCDNNTWHMVVAAASRAGGGDDEAQFQETWQIVQCQGCDELSFRLAYRDETDWDSESVSVFPARAVGRRAIQNQWVLPRRVMDIYRETHRAACSNLPTLAAIGVRALVEAVCREKGAQGKTLEARIQDLVKKGILTADGAETLHGARFLGNEAAHEVETPSPLVLDAALTVAEHLLHSVYVIGVVASTLRKSKAAADGASE